MEAHVLRHLTISNKLRQRWLLLFLLVLVEKRFDFFAKKEQSLFVILPQVISFDQILSHRQVLLYTPSVDSQRELASAFQTDTLQWDAPELRVALGTSESLSCKGL